MLSKTALAMVILAVTGCSQSNSNVGEVTDMTKNNNVKASPAVVTPVKSDAETRAKLAQKGLFEGKLIVEDNFGSAMNVTLQYRNTQSYGVPLMFNSGMTADLWLFDSAGRKVWAWSNEMMFTQALRETVMPAGKTQNVKFRIGADVAKEIGKGFYFKAIFSGRATESQTPAMAPVIYKF
ncbi:BsuPI-related putative proteinase inhibitor [Shewanella kaireitica]|uniref:BsuPI-related putative proteinase inhibitor n=1 Tax=Shewanella kaireitica TaxID=212021 RepID=UPI00200DF956|nr:BsuPI-related putative proteinase inhibitor [Shewanella kaireitica]MCL1095214.1 BsuPI-related putative proteinase inhibitor [Shewanella kaireitica]